MEKHAIPLIERRKLTRSGTSVVLRVPQDWMKENGLKEGDDVIMVANGDLVFKKINPENIEAIRQKLVPITLTRSDDDQIGEKTRRKQPLNSFPKAPLT